MYTPHVSVVRKEIPKNLAAWGLYQGEAVNFFYVPVVHANETYIWLNVFCRRLEEIRLELGLPISSQYTRPPDGYTKCFHTTLGNFKNL